jgi:hypothetical protein
MQAKVIRELWNKVSWWHYEGKCDVCSKKIGAEDARYNCKECRYNVCMECTSWLLARNRDKRKIFVPPTADVGTRNAYQANPQGPSKVQPGDILLVGPDRWGIHHVVLSTGHMRPDPETGKMLKQEMPELRGTDIYSCQTIESTHASLTSGKEIVWYVAKSYIARNRVTGEAMLVADIADGEDTLEFFEKPVQVKMLMHPCRPGHGAPPFDKSAFAQALEVCAQTSKAWSIKTAVNGILKRRDLQALDPEAYPDAASRAALLEGMKKRWETRPICTSVAIMVWQRYFMLSSIGSSRAEATDIAAQNILRWMPLLSDRTLPSGLIKELSKCGWVMRGNLDV